jgi:hypothetical protein
VPVLPAQMERGKRIRGRAFLTGLARSLDRGLTAIVPGGSLTDFVGVPGNRSSIKINLVHRDWACGLGEVCVRFAGSHLLTDGKSR